MAKKWRITICSNRFGFPGRESGSQRKANSRRKWLSQLWHNFAKTVCKSLKNSGRACKPDSVRRTFPEGTACRGDHSSRSRLTPRLQQPTRGLLSMMACAVVEGGRSLSRTFSASRAGSPLLFGLAPRGVFRASDVATGAVGSYPTFSPLPNWASISKTPRRFSCAMPPCFSQPAVYSLWHFP